MELDWTTFILEIVNFLILVWLLRRFLYRPVMEFIARRRAETQEVQASACRDREQADELKRQYEVRLSDWAQERDSARKKLRQELERERATRLEEIGKAIEEERKKAQVAEDRRRREFREQTEQDALALGARFAAHLLERASSAQSTSALTSLVTEGVAALSPVERAALRQAGKDMADQGLIETAHPLDAEQRIALETVLADLFGRREWEWRLVAELVAGLRITLGAWVLAVNVRDELKDFIGLIHASPVT